MIHQVTGQFAGYIRARPLPNIGTWTEFSPAQVASFCGASYRPSPTISDPTIPKSSWVMPIPDEKKGSIRIIVLIKDNYNREKNVKYWTRNPITNNNESDIGEHIGADPEFPFDAGWALKENLQLDRYSPEAMHASLENLVTEGELVSEEIPTIKTIKGWIGRYSKSFKKEASERALIETNGVVNNSNSSESSTNRASKRQKTNPA
ncbi:13652_t:CDS:2 [Rhizophagus irregularis]|nr:13652_t:CDS:2 [Rhizophagus irregularis]